MASPTAVQRTGDSGARRPGVVLSKWMCSCFQRFSGVTSHGTAVPGQEEQKILGPGLQTSFPHLFVVSGFPLGNWCMRKVPIGSLTRPCPEGPLPAGIHVENHIRSTSYLHCGIVGAFSLIYLN